MCIAPLKLLVKHLNQPLKENFLLLLSHHVGRAPAANTIIPLLKMCILSNSHVLLDWMPRAKGIGL